MSRTDLPITASMGLALLAGCGQSHGTAANQAWQNGNDVAVCRDAAGRRIGDDACRTHTGGGWYYIGRGGYIPAAGGVVGGGSPYPAAGHRYALASTVTRGGFGSTVEAHGGGEGGHGGGAGE